MLKKLGLLSLAAVSSFAMHTFEININEKDLGLSGKYDIGQYNNKVEPGTTFVGVRYLKGSEDNGNMLERHPFSEINFLKVKEISNTGISLGLGVKVNTTVIDKKTNFKSIPLGLEVVYALPNVEIIPVTVNASAYYAPEVLSLDDAVQFSQINLNARLEVIENGLIVLGYRKMDMKLSTPTEEDSEHTTSRTYNDSFYLGFKFAF